VPKHDRDLPMDVTIGIKDEDGYEQSIKVSCKNVGAQAVLVTSADAKQA